MRFAITNQERTLFLTNTNERPHNLKWTTNVNLSFIFETEKEANEYEEAPSVNKFLDLESDVLWYVNEISDLLDAERARVAELLKTHYGIEI